MCPAMTWGSRLGSLHPSIYPPTTHSREQTDTGRARTLQTILREATGAHQGAGCHHANQSGLHFLLRQQIAIHCESISKSPSECHRRLRLLYSALKASLPSTETSVSSERPWPGDPFTSSRLLGHNSRLRS